LLQQIETSMIVSNYFQVRISGRFGTFLFAKRANMMSGTIESRT